MATVTVAKPDVFPDGTALSAYTERSTRRHGQTIDFSGAAVATATVTSGTASLTGLADGTSYVITGTVGGRQRFLVVRTAEVGTGLAALLTAVTAPNGLKHPLWRQRRRALGLV